MPSPFVTDVAAMFSGVATQVAYQRTYLGLTPLRAPASTSPSGQVGPLLIGEEWLAVEHTPPRIVIVPTGCRYEAAKRMGVQPQVPGDVSQIEPKTRRTRWIQFEAHCWGNEDPATASSVYSFSSALELERELLTSLMDNLGNNPNVLNVGSARFEQPTHLTRLGRVLIVPFEVATPVTDLPLIVLPFATDTVSGVTVYTTESMLFPDGSSSVAGVVIAPPP